MLKLLAAAVFIKRQHLFNTWCLFEEIQYSAYLKSHKLLAVKLKTTHKPAKPTTNYPQISQTTHKPPKYLPNHSQTSQISGKPPKNQQIMSRKSFSVTKIFRNNAKHELNFLPFYSNSLTFTSEDQSHVGIEGKWCEII